MANRLVILIVFANCYGRSREESEFCRIFVLTVSQMLVVVLGWERRGGVEGGEIDVGAWGGGGGGF